MGFSEGIDTMLNRMQACLANTHRLHEMTISKVKSGLRYSVQVNGVGGGDCLYLLVLHLCMSYS